jgi:2-polyprenyl-3-methyl-5-hydroxy-6-metoxy-1,4-benzoquinol methylase
LSYSEPNLIDALLEELMYRFYTSFYSDYLATLRIRGNERMLEFGSGGGAFSRQIIQWLSAGGMLTCLDISEFWMNKAKARLNSYPNIQFFQGDISDMEGGGFDIVLIHMVLHDIPHSSRQKIVQTLAGKMNHGGVLYIREPTKESHGMLADEIRALMNDAGLFENTYSMTKSFFTGLLYEGMYKKYQADGDKATSIGAISTSPHFF